MMISTVRIWNMALGFIGTRTVASQDERSPESMACALYWDTARRAALRDFPYNFAQRRVFLAAVQLPEVFACEYSQAYALPDQCLKAHKIKAGGRVEQRFIVAVNGETQQNILLTQAKHALLMYTADIYDVGLWDDLFVIAMARKLACCMAVSLLKNNSTKVQELEQLYNLSIPKAREANSSEGEPEPKDDAWLSSRGFYDD